MRALALLVIVSLTAGAQRFDPRFQRFGSRTDQGRSRRGFFPSGLAAFEAFAGQGTTTACSATPPTGARGEVLTFTSGGGMCTKTATGGLATTGIANGDIVGLGPNVARVEYDSAGVLGLLIEASRTNVALQSEALDNAVWTSCSGAMTVTANQTGAPVAGNTAERVQLAAGGFNAICQTVTTAGAGARTITAFVKDLASSNGISIRAIGTGDATGDATCEALAISTTSWSRVTCTTGVYAAGLTAISLRFFNSTTVSARNFDGYIWGTQIEVGAYATSYIPTTTVAVARAAESASFPNVVLTTGGCVAASVTPDWGAGNGPTNFGIVGSGSAATDFLYGRGGSNLFVAYDSTNNPTLAAAWVAGSTLRGGNAWSGSSMTLSNFTASTSTGTSFDGSYTSSSLMVGTSSQVGVNPADGIISRLMADPISSRCR